MDESLQSLWSLLGATLRGGTPLILAALGGLMAERAGVANLALEGKMLAAAFAAAATAWVSGSPWAGVGAGMAAAMALAAVHAFACVTCRGNQIVSGIALNILVAGLTPTLAEAWFGLGGQTPLLPASARFAALTLPGGELLAGVPGLGAFYGTVVSGHNLLVYLALAAVPLLSWGLARTRFGLRLRAVGEAPEAVEGAGLSVRRLRWQALLLSGLLCGLAGAYLSIAQGGGFVRDMTAGKGYLALAALIFGRWRPWPTLAACLLFALTDAAQLRLQGLSLGGMGELPVQFVQMLPYGLTVLLLAAVVGRTGAPRALGRPYPEHR